MPTLIDLAGRMTTESAERAILEFFPDIDEMFAVLPFKQAEAEAHTWYRPNKPVTASPTDPFGPVPQLTPSGTKKTTYLKAFIGDVDVYDWERVAMQNIIDKVAEKSQSAVESIVRGYKKVLINGNPANNANEFEGIDKYVDVGQVVDTGTNGSALSFDLLDQLIDKVTPRPDAIIMHPRTFRSYRALLRTLNLTPEYIQLQGFGRPVPTYDGIPILRNEYIPTNLTKGTGTNLTRVYAVRFGTEAASGLYFGDNAGVSIQEIGKLESKAAVRYRVQWFAGFYVHSPWHVAKIEGVTN